MLKTLQTAISMENSIKKEFENLLKDSPDTTLKPLLKILIESQALTLQLLYQNRDHAQACKNLGISDQILFRDDEWRRVANLIDNNSDTQPCLVKLWMILALVDKSSQYYRQSALNSAYQQNKLFLNSIGDIKLIQKRRIDSFLRSIYNIIWAEVGFAPFTLGKD